MSRERFLPSRHQAAHTEDWELAKLTERHGRPRPRHPRTQQVGARDAEIVAEQLGPEVTPQDLRRLPRYHAYVRLLIDGQPSRPFSMQTLAPATVRHDQHRPAIIRRYSRQRYARPLPQVEAEIRESFVCT